MLQRLVLGANSSQLTPRGDGVERCTWMVGTRRVTSSSSARTMANTCSGGQRFYRRGYAACDQVHVIIVIETEKISSMR